MPSENVKRLMEGLQAMERGDVEAIAALAHPEVEFVNPDSALEPGTRTGPRRLEGRHERVARRCSRICAFETKHAIDLGDRMVATGSFRGRGRGSGMAFGPSPFAIVLTLRDTKLVRFEWFNDADEALRAAGIAPGEAVWSRPE